MEKVRASTCANADYDGRTDPIIQEPAPAPEPEAMMSLDPIYFDFDKSDLKPEAIATLSRDAQALKKNPAMKVRIEGNCDERGTSEYNMALGDRRAVSAMKYLKTMGIAADQMTAISYGKEKPSCTEHDEECWSKNRRDNIRTYLSKNKQSLLSHPGALKKVLPVR